MLRLVWTFVSTGMGRFPEMSRQRQFGLIPLKRVLWQTLCQGGDLVALCQLATRAGSDANEDGRHKSLSPFLNDLFVRSCFWSNNGNINWMRIETKAPNGYGLNSCWVPNIRIHGARPSGPRKRALKLIQNNTMARGHQLSPRPYWRRKHRVP